ncbi:NADPH-dependent 1-acyldihydroxyacetone phosphate reductase [Sparassis crispa]|uniref:NADPH-dependent 1-acyldihydroxyacetone phosphate reductase n=1 Tax=Sparassis crispa TaxID=139825 RepID=A0A401GX10_9APHY|nr:NADPH-dependent 1-acyldihydroxyacetone phosphate reductase [Sparassis crispa]GBE86720.1 NADPH-dependent 1-acyldihydroxyacetone phosphate reductase [Sparassis crispa]
MAGKRRTVLVTGCSRGSIGDALAREFHTKGLTVFAASRTLESMEGLCALGIRTLMLDVTDIDGIRRAKTEIAEATGGTLDILVNNAGQTYVRTAADYDMARVRALFEANLFGAMAMVQEFLPLLIASGDAVIMNNGSIAGFLASPFRSAYNASKAALHAYSDTLRIELAPFNIRVVTLVTGGVKSNISQPASLPPDSLYAPMAALFQESCSRVESDEARMATDDYARAVVAEALCARPRPRLWAGSMAWWIWLGDALLPRWAWDLLLTKIFGLDVFAKMVASEKKDV